MRPRAALFAQFEREGEQLEQVFIFVGFSPNEHAHILKGGEEGGAVCVAIAARDMGHGVRIMFIIDMV